jgi:hypothetical protein
LTEPFPQGFFHLGGSVEDSGVAPSQCCNQALEYRNFRGQYGQSDDDEEDSLEEGEKQADSPDKKQGPANDMPPDSPPLLIVFTRIASVYHWAI